MGERALWQFFFSRSVSTSFLMAICLIFDLNSGNLENVGRGAQGVFFTNFSLNPLLITESVQLSSATASQCHQLVEILGSKVEKGDDQRLKKSYF
jgi:hypothetical protein